MTNIAKPRRDELLLVQSIINPSRYDFDVWISVKTGFDTFWGGEDVEKDDAFLRYAVLHEHFYCFNSTPTGRQHRVKKEDIARADVVGQFGVKQLGQGCLFVALN